MHWRARVANRKIFRRTQKKHDIIHAETKWFSHHDSVPLAGTCANFVPGGTVDFGHVRYILPTETFPEIRLRFTPAKGVIYGSNKFEPEDTESGKQILTHKSQRVYDADKGNWYHFRNEKPEHETVPPSLFAITPPAPSWLYNNRAISRGYFDDACDGFVDVALVVGGRRLVASARICAAPPAVVPDSLFVRSLADDLEQVINGPGVAVDEPLEVTRARRGHRAARLRNGPLHECRGDERQQLQGPLRAHPRLDAGGGGRRYRARHQARDDAGGR
ncbi:MAG: hypothetical protein IOC86_10575 [Aestuariivirga sp.]|nr:hypothetical protein [Aestuariivirga sp.]